MTRDPYPRGSGYWIGLSITVFAFLVLIAVNICQRIWGINISPIWQIAAIVVVAICIARFGLKRQSEPLSIASTFSGVVVGIGIVIALIFVLIVATCSPKFH